jgi:hypothetical protein
MLGDCKTTTLPSPSSTHLCAYRAERFEAAEVFHLTQDLEDYHRFSTVDPFPPRFIPIATQPHGMDAQSCYITGNLFTLVSNQEELSSQVNLEGVKTGKELIDGCGELQPSGIVAELGNV